MMTATKNMTISQGENTRAMESAAAAAERGGKGSQAADDVKAMVEARVQSALEEALSQPPQPEVAEPLYWWDIYAVGPIQSGAQQLPPASFAGPLLPHQVIRLGEEAHVATVLVLNPFFPTPGPSAGDVLSNFGLPYEIEYDTGNLTTWTKEAALSGKLTGLSFTPNVYFYVNVISLRPQQPGLYEMNIMSRIFGCNGITAPPFSGFVTMVRDIDAKLFGPGPVTNFQQPVRFQVYK